MFPVLIDDKSSVFKYIPESEENNIEYKWRLDAKSTHALDKMVFQMNWRLEQGNQLYGISRCHYVLGVHDDGTIGKLSKVEINETFTIFQNVVKKAMCEIVYYDEKNYADGYICLITLTKIKKKIIDEFRVGFVGDSQTGKTTTISNIVFGEIDDGNARQMIFKHVHERESGFTSSVIERIIGIKNGEIINNESLLSSSWEDIVEMSDKIITLVDFPGNISYFKTVLSNLLTMRLDYLLIFSGNEISTTKHFYTEFAKKNNIPYTYVYINDDGFNIFRYNIIHITNIMKNGLKVLLDLLIEKASEIQYNQITPKQYDNDIFIVYDVTTIQEIGTIFIGEMLCGKLKKNDDIMLTDGGKIFTTKIKSIHKKQISVNDVCEHEICSILTNGVFDKNKKNYKHIFISTKTISTTKTITVRINSDKYANYNSEIIVYVQNNFSHGTIKTFDKETLIIVIELSKPLVIFNNKKCIILKISNEYVMCDLVNITE